MDDIPARDTWWLAGISLISGLDLNEMMTSHVYRCRLDVGDIPVGCRSLHSRRSVGISMQVRALLGHMLASWSIHVTPIDLHVLI
jgi:hypothetical protein